MEIIKLQSIQILKQLSFLVSQLTPSEFQLSLALLSQNTIGKHVRHIIEFYSQLLNAKRYVNYDARKRNLLLETDSNEALHTLEELCHQIPLLSDKPVVLVGEYIIDNAAKPFETQSTLSRELLYNIEHAVHHMAIIKIAVMHNFPTVEVGKNFGVASSTVQFQKEQSSVVSNAS